MSNLASMKDYDIADPESVRLTVEDPARHEKALWYAVIERAMRDAKGARDESNAHARNLYRGEARAWFASNSNAVGSLKWIISQTGLKTTVAAVRRSVMAAAKPHRD